MIGHSMDDLALKISQLKGISVDDAMRFLSGKEFATGAQARMIANGAEASRLGRFASGPIARKGLRFVPGLATFGAVSDAADILTNDTSVGNKVMDTAGMAIGGTIGALGGPLGAVTGASVGKMASDGLQYLFGDRKTPQQRKLEEALILLNGGRI